LLLQTQGYFPFLGESPQTEGDMSCMSPGASQGPAGLRNEPETCNSQENQTLTSH
jgi:hypothetical protein